MDDDQPTLRNIGKEVFSPGYLARAQERQKTKTIWDLVFLPVRWALVACTWYIFYRGLIALYTFIYPEAAGLATQLMKEKDLSGFLITAPILLPAIPLGFMLSNGLMWLVSPARRAAELKAEGVRWAGYRQSQVGLWSIFKFLAIPAFIAGIAGVLLLGSS